MLTLKNATIASSLHFINQLVRRMIGIVSLIILARVLTPEDFGLVAIALIFMNFVTVVTEFGGPSYLLSREKINDQQVLSNWTLTFLIYNSVAVMLAISSVFIANYYEDPRLTPIILVFSLQIFVSSLASPGVIYLHKHQKLGALTRWQIASRFVTTAITIAIAVIYKTYWALVIGQFLVTLSSCIAGYVVAPLKPRFTLVNVKEQWEFSKWLMPQSLVNFFRNQIDAIWVSTMFDKAIMGAYNSMRYYAMIPATLFVQPIMNVTLAQFSEFKNNAVYFAKQMQVTFFALTIIASPIIYLMIKHDAIIVKIILGDKWVEYSALLSTFSWLVFLNVINRILGQIAMLKDKTKLLLHYSIACVIAQVLLFTIVDFEDIYQLAQYKILTDVLLAGLFYVFIIARLLSLQSLWLISQPILISIGLIYVASLYDMIVPRMEHELIDFFVQCLAFAVAYGTTMLITMYLLKDKVYCFRYIFDKFNLVLKKIGIAQ